MNVLSALLLILYLTEQGFQEGREIGAWKAGAWRASESIQGHHLLLHREMQASRGSVACGKLCGKAGKELGLDADAQSRAPSNFL